MRLEICEDLRSARRRWALLLKRNILANYISQFFGTLLSILVIPFYLRLLGPAAYGLIGFFAVLQIAFNKLDAGLSGSMARETARHQSIGDSLTYRRLLRAVHSLFLIVGVVIGAALFLGAGAIESSWLQSDELSSNTIVFAIQVMAFALAARWYSGLQRGIIMGAERQVWLSGFNFIFSSLRHAGALLLLYTVGATVFLFFTYQALLAAFELLVLVWKARRIIPAVEPGESIGWSLRPLTAVVGFSLSISFASLVWLAITQLDRLMLSTLLPLAEFGAFTVAVMLGTGVLISYDPLGLAVRPRLAKLYADGNQEAFIRLYRQTTQLMSIIAASVGTTLALFAHEFLLAWTSDQFVSDFAAPIVQLYALGSAIVGVGALPYYLQFAIGDLRLHVQYNVLSLVVRVPLIIAATILYGAIGAGAMWLGWNFVFFFVWPLLVHRRFVPGLHSKWVRTDILPIYLIAGSVAIVGKLILPGSLGRAGMLIGIGFIGAMSLAAAVLASHEGRRRVQRWLRPSQGALNHE